MICPACKRDMIDVEYHKIELDYCTHCRGVWFDADELGFLIEGVGLGECGLAVVGIVGLPEVETVEKGRKCPICGRRMGKAHIGHEPRVLIDVCRWGDGLWFDGGEVAQVMKQLIKKMPQGQDSQQKVINFLGEVFTAQD